MNYILFLRYVRTRVASATSGSTSSFLDSLHYVNTCRLSYDAVNIACFGLWHGCKSCLANILPGVHCVSCTLLLCVTEIAVALCYRDRCCFVLQRSLLLCVTEIAVALCYRDCCCFVLQRSLLLCVTEITVALCYRDRNRWPIFAGLKFVLFFAYWELSNTFIRSTNFYTNCD